MGRDATGGVNQPDPVDDGLVIPDVGPWANRKYHFINRYFRIFSTGMKYKWPRRYYFDLFSGAGFARIKGSGKIVYSSALMAADIPDQFTKLHLCEQNNANADALAARLNRLFPSQPVTIYRGDANNRINDMVRDYPKGALGVAFVDPFALHVDFETIRTLGEHRIDLIILFADDMDALRNWAAYYYSNPESSLDRFMGEPGWRDILDSGKVNAAEKLRKRYCQRLSEELGYSYTDSERIQNTSGHNLYSLIFASKNKKGLEFWAKARQVDEGGQRSLFGGD